MGLVARDHTGELVQAKSLSKQDIVFPEFAEVIAIKEALSWIKMKKLPIVEVEFDC